jgi:hypothetical protein
MKLLFCMSLLVLGSVLPSCSKASESEPAKSPASDEPAPMPPSAPECVDDQGNEAECETDADCCKGFVCSKDPEQTFRSKFCVYAG